MRTVVLAALMTAMRGTMAFHYGGPLTPAEIQWCGRFDVLVTHDPLPRDQVDALHKLGTRLALYEWAVGYYGAKRAHALNATPLRGGTAAADIDAYYYDPATREHERERPRAIAARLKAIGYDGVFLDCTTRENVHPAALAEYEQRHPHIAYDAAFARFMAALRKQLPLVITNQGYRDAGHYLPYVDYDVTESLITRPHAGLRPWDEQLDPWNSIDFVLRYEILPVMKKYPRVKFVHLNYADDAKPVETVVSIARLYGGDAFVALPSVVPIPSEAYFVNVGRPRGEIHRSKSKTWRKFTRGEIVVDVEGGTAIARMKPNDP